MEDEIEMQEGTAAGVVDPQGESEQPANSEQDGAAPAQQSHEDNRRYQAARKRGEADGAAKTKRQYDEALAAMGMRNSISGEEIRSLEDLEAYNKAVKKQRAEEIAKKTGRTAAEVEEEDANRAYISRQRKKEENSAEEQRERAQKDIEEFNESFPDADLNAVLENQDFRKFARGDIGKVPLAELYGDYLDFSEKAGKAATQKKESKEQRATGTGGGSGRDTLTTAQQEDLNRWNEAYPQYKMTAKEYLAFKSN